MYKLFKNSTIHTLNPDLPIANALLIAGDRIVFCGDEKDINLPQHQVQSINLNDLHLYPSFTDCHTHVASVALKKERIHLDDCNSLNEAINLISTHIKKSDSDTWILGGGWNANRWSDGFPHKKILDKISTNHPIALYNKDCHTQWLNSKAIAVVGFDQLTNDPEGGKLGRESNGDLNGLVYEKACDIVNSYAEVNSFTQLKRCMDKLAPELYALGITSVHSCESLEIWRFFQQMELKKDIKLRIYMNPPIENAEKFIEGGLCSGFGNEWLRLGGLKYFVDGSLGSQTAEMFDNYTGLNHSGIEVLSESKLAELLQKTTAKGFSATIHAIGDKANFKSLNALQSVESISRSLGLRHRIEHAQMIRDEDLPRFAKHNIIASMQPLHISDDVRLSDKYLGERSSRAYRINGFIKSGARVVFGSDMPITDPDPLKGILAAYSRRYLLDKNEPRWNESECISISQALRCYTIEAAYASYEEGLKGTLEVGKLADFIGIPFDIQTANEDTLREAKVKLTVLNGEVVFQDNI